MRKIKKINGFLVVKFNDREKREYEGTALGEYGVIDAEVYTGNLDIDRGAMEYDDADTLEVAVELARGLESEEDITDEPQPQAQRADPVRHQPRDPQRLQWGHQRGGLRAGGGCEAG